ncbi:scavenger receptor cysteine-rich domain-containing group B protein-like [Myotis daubentonii]|uniref:scavenger receptor cysteine-rich domain-containing group B protein-like n=1 Tax=Myotis daubentonii TaxID=98922 RepID=UPI0028738263|nr:scavenger receptor cysteine-rich domain-containing group B protein-like [Myotis daubentonii]
MCECPFPVSTQTPRPPPPTRTPPPRQPPPQAKSPRHQGDWFPLYPTRDPGGGGAPCPLTLAPSPADRTLRLAGGHDPCEGRVEVWHRGAWGTVCDDGWSLRNARVVCRLLGCGRALSAPGRARFGPGAGPILLDRVRCAGAEDALGSCAHAGWTRHHCRHLEDAGVVCSAPEPQDSPPRD